MPVYVQALLEQTAENLEGLQRILARGEEGRAQTNQAMLTPDRAARDARRTRCVPTSSSCCASPRAGRSSPRRCSGWPSAAPDGGDEVVRGAPAQHRDLPAAAAEEMTSRAARRHSRAAQRDQLLTRTIAALAEEQPR